jgi:uncharacterized protein (DUF1330 family)
MKAYAIAQLSNVRMGAPIVTYLERIDATLAPFGGMFIIHGGPIEALEGGAPDALIAIEFPDIDAARGWYKSDAYQAILPLRTENSDGTAFILTGVDASHKATDVLA